MHTCLGASDGRSKLRGSILVPRRGVVACSVGYAKERLKVSASWTHPQHTTAKHACNIATVLE